MNGIPEPLLSGGHRFGSVGDFTNAVVSDEQLERLADLVVERLASKLQRKPVSPPLLDAIALAAALGVSRQWVYAHAEDLGVERLPGSGSKPRLRFDLERARDAMARCGSNQSMAVERSAGAKSGAPMKRGRHPRTNGGSKPGSILVSRPVQAA